MVQTVDALEVTIDPISPTAVNGGRVSRFSTVDEDTPVWDPFEDPYPFAEWAGQHVFDTQRGVIIPRPVVRFQTVADRDNPIIAGGVQSGAGVEEPFSRFGAKTQLVWRDVDLGLDPLSVDTGLPDLANINIDVEGLNWSPFTGQVVVDSYERFEIRANHSGFLPSVLGGQGLGGTFDQNFLSSSEDPQRVLHDDSLGYLVQPGDAFAVGQGTVLMPFPLNRNIDPEDYTYYTWRDTNIEARGGENTLGSPVPEWFTATGIAGPLAQDCMGVCAIPGPPFYSPGNVESVHLPLLLEFRCFPDDGATGINRFDASNMIGTSFRAYSSGGTDTNGQTIRIDPDLEATASGGFNPLSTPIAGAPTPALDDILYIGAVDFVVRISRSYSVWFPAEDSGGNQIPVPQFQPATFEPPMGDQPLGTNIEIDVRGAAAIDPLGTDPTTAGFESRAIATQLDPYGNHYVEGADPCSGAGLPNAYPAFSHNAGLELNTAVGFLNGDQSWYRDVSQINGAQFYQIRVTFTSDPVSGLVPELSSIGMTWTD